MMWPSDLVRWTLERVLPIQERDMILGDLEEEYRERILPRAGRVLGEVWHAGEAFSLVLHFAWDTLRSSRQAHQHLDKNRSQQGGMTMGWSRDVVHAVKTLVREPVTALVVVVTLALGIGANTAMFSVVDTALLRALPYPGQDRLVQISNGWRGQEFRAPLSPLDLQDVESRSDLIELVGAYNDASAHLTSGAGEPRRLQVAAASTGFFALLGYQPLLGRSFTPDDEVPGQDRSTILSHSLWVSEFGADSALVGTTITLNGVEVQVAGVAPAEFRMPVEADLWMPLALDPEVWHTPDRRGWQFLNTFGRLREGITTEVAGAGLTARMAEMAPHRVNDQGQYLVTLPLREHMLGDTGPVLALLMGWGPCG